MKAKLFSSKSKSQPQVDIPQGYSSSHLQGQFNSTILPSIVAHRPAIPPETRRTTAPVPPPDITQLAQLQMNDGTEFICNSLRPKLTTML
jgi:hypothetical protein